MPRTARGVAAAGGSSSGGCSRSWDSSAIHGPADLAALLPVDLVEPFTTADLAARLRRPRRLAQQMTYCLRTAGIIEPADARVRNVRYRLVRPIGP